jgi:hypothetical protein
MSARPYTLEEAVGALVKSVADRAPGPARYAVYVCVDQRRVKRLGEVRSLGAAFELLANDYWPEEAPGGMTLEDQLGVPESAYALPEELAWLKPQLARLPETKYRALVYRMGGILEPMTVEVERPWENPYLGRVLRKHPGGRFLFLCSAAPPHHDDACAIIELAPARKLSPDERKLHVASGRGDAAAVGALLKRGFAPGTADLAGNTSLHAAVAGTSLPVVQLLVAAGADANAGMEVGNAPIFAVAHAKTKAIAPKLTAPKDAAHLELLEWLLDHGADARATTGNGETLIDRALLAPKYPEAWIADLVRRKVTSRLLDEKDPLHAIVEEVSVQYWRPPRRLLHQLRYLLERGEDPHRRGGLRKESPLHQFLTTGYSEAESNMPFFVEMFELFVANGLTDHRNSGGTLLSALARGWVEHGYKHYGALVDVLQRARTPVTTRRRSRGRGR